MNTGYPKRPETRLGGSPARINAQITLKNCSAGNCSVASAGHRLTAGAWSWLVCDLSHSSSGSWICRLPVSPEWTPGVTCFSAVIQNLAQVSVSVGTRVLARCPSCQGGGNSPSVGSMSSCAEKSRRVRTCSLRHHYPQVPFLSPLPTCLIHHSHSLLYLQLFKTKNFIRIQLSEACHHQLAKQAQT